MENDTGKADVAPPANDEGAEIPPEATSPPLTSSLDLESFFNRQEDERNREREQQDDQPPPDSEEIPPEPDADEASKRQEPEEEPEEDVPSNRTEKRIKKLIDDLKAATREAEEWKAKAQSPKDEPDNGPPNVFELVEKSNSPQELQAIQDQAERVRYWAMRNLHKEFAEGPDGQEVSHDEVVEKLEIAEDILSKQIPQRKQLLQQRVQADQIAIQKFPGWQDPDSEQGQWFASMLRDPQTREVVDKFPNGKLILGYIWKGLQADQAEAQQQGKPKQPEQPSQPQQPARKSAPSLPGMKTSSVPSRISPSQEQNREQLKKSVLSSGEMTSNDLEAYFNATAQR